MITKDEIGGLSGSEVYDDAGHRIGTVGQVYTDPETGAPLWVTVRTGSMSFQESFAPLHNARLAAGRLTVAVAADPTRSTPTRPSPCTPSSPW